MKLGLGLTQRSGAVNPYAAFDLAWDSSSAANYTLSGGRVSAVQNLGSGGPSYGGSQATEAERPVIATMADGSDGFYFSASAEWIRGDAIGSAMNVGTDKRLVEIVFEHDTLSADRTLCSWKQAGGGSQQYCHITLRTTGVIRIARRGASASFNKILDTSASIPLNINAVNVLSLLFEAGNVTGYLNAELILNNVDWLGTATPDLLCDSFALGAFLDSTLAAPTTPFDGKIMSFAFRSY